MNTKIKEKAAGKPQSYISYARMPIFMGFRAFFMPFGSTRKIVSDDGDLTKVLYITSGDELEVIENGLNQLPIID